MSQRAGQLTQRKVCLKFFFPRFSYDFFRNFQTAEIRKKNEEKKSENRSDNEAEEEEQPHDSKEQRLTLMEEVL